LACAISAFIRGDCPKSSAAGADVGRAAALYPNMNFSIYHSGYEAGTTEALMIQNTLSAASTT
jgi:hypothetical protein